MPPWQAIWWLPKSCATGSGRRGKAGRFVWKKQRQHQGGLTEYMDAVIRGMVAVPCTSTLPPITTQTDLPESHRLVDTRPAK
jgi:hypothetical protein